MDPCQYKERAFHSDVIIGDNVFSWGGVQKDTSPVKDSPEKRQLTSIDVLNLLTGKWEKRQTSGNPPNGVCYYSCCSIGDNIYYFGGSFKPKDFFHNDLFVLNTTNNKWREIKSYENQPIRKNRCGMIPFNIDGEDYLLVIGGRGPIPMNSPRHSQYSPNPNDPQLCYTNEVHIMCIRTGKWIIPVKSGDTLDPCAGFTINALPGNKAVLYGGSRIMKDGEKTVTEESIILSFTSNSVNFQRLVKPIDIQRPSRRVFHSSVVMSSVSGNGVKRHYLLVSGGETAKGVASSDIWLMDTASKNWKQALHCPEFRSVLKCRSHSLSCYMLSSNCVWLIATGGVDGSRIFITSSNSVRIIELVFSPTDDNWCVSKVLNQQDMRNTPHYSELLIQRLSEGRKEVQMNAQLRFHQEAESDQLKMSDDEKSRRIEELQEIRKRNIEEIQSLRDQMESRPWILDRNEVMLTQQKIGKGAYGEVKVAVFRSTRVAAKCLHELIVSDYNRGVFTREMEISSRIHHPNIVQFIGATRVDNPILLYELMATSLYKRLQEGKPLTHPQILSISCDVLSALCYLHGWRPHPIIHRDVSSPNVLIEPLPNDRYRSKLSDFGSANLQLHVKTVIPGNPAYAAPEANIPQHHTPAMDVYSFGILMTEMILHRPPEMEPAKRHRQACSIDWTPVDALVLKCTDNDRTKRITSVQLLKELPNDH